MIKSLRVYAFVSAVLVVFALTAVQADDWPQWLGSKRDGVWRETGLVKQFPKEGLKVRWRAPVGQGYSGPAVASGRVYLTDFALDEGGQGPKSGFTKQAMSGKEHVFCFDEKTGRELWKH